MSRHQNYRLAPRLQAVLPWRRPGLVCAVWLFMQWPVLVHSQILREDGVAFDANTVIAQARNLAGQPYVALPQAPEALTALDYSSYRQINYRHDEAVWGQAPTPFSVQLFAPGFLYRDLVDIRVVENGKAYPLMVSAESFTTPTPELSQLLAKIGRYAGFRLHYPLNTPDYADEFLVFQGASFFRGVSEGQNYGLSARGLAVDVAEGKGEEHPVFRRFWIERPANGDNALVVHALLDSVSVSGAYRLAIYPGRPTTMDVDVTLFPRRDLQHVGLGPLTSMFIHGDVDQPIAPDYRPAVHDSEGLAIAKGNGERLWRPLGNPQRLQASAFIDDNPRGFGLVQRARDFPHYQDLEANYHRRPSAWVQPRGDWGRGQVQLIEIPSDSEANDNIVAYWRPAQTLAANEPFSYAYRLTWPDLAPGLASLARVLRSSYGHKLFSSSHEYTIDFGALQVPLEEVTVDASISQGRILETTLQANPEIAGARLFVSFAAAEEAPAELRVALLHEGRQVAETWLYRWIPDA